jgi:uncharacterized protein YybS (DUF2232 family)
MQINIFLVYVGIGLADYFYLRKKMTKKETVIYIIVGILFLTLYMLSILGKIDRNMGEFLLIE